MKTQKKWTSYGEIFNAIVSVISHDYAGGERLGDRNIPFVGARLALTNSRYYHGDDAMFFHDARQYLGALGDPNLRVWKADADPIRDWEIGIRERACEDGLFVTEAAMGSGFEPGDEIFRIDDSEISEFRKGARRYQLYGETPERENWDFFLQYAKKVEVLRDGETLVVKPKHFPADGSAWKASPRQASPRQASPRQMTAIFRSMMDAGVSYLRLDDLPDEETMAKRLSAALPDEGKDTRPGEKKRLILDLRCCEGGDISGIVPLVPYLIDRPMSPAEFMGELGLYLRYSHKNVLRMVCELEMERDGQSQDLQEEYNAEIGRILSLKGKGFVWEPAELPEEWYRTVQPCGPKEVIVLADIGCRAAGELLCRMAARSPRVVTMGRATCGDSDYQEERVISFEDDIFFAYPMGMTKEAWEGNGILRCGAPVQVEIPWTPEEIRQDVVLERAIAWKA